MLFGADWDWICLIFVVRDGIDGLMGVHFFVVKKGLKSSALLLLLLCQGHNEVPQCSLTILSYTLLNLSTKLQPNNIHSVLLAHHVKEYYTSLSLNTYI
jgi:hypothetical protein